MTIIIDQPWIDTFRQRVESEDSDIEVFDVTDADSDHNRAAHVDIEIEDMMAYPALKGYDQVHLMYKDQDLVRAALYKSGAGGETFEQDDTGLAG